MYVILTAVKPERALIELIILVEDRVILACWQPKAYATRCRIERVARGKSLDRAQFIAIASAVPSILMPHLIGKTPNEVSALVGSCFHLEDTKEEEEMVPAETTPKAKKATTRKAKGKKKATTA